jgi:hypothetical protein
MVKVAARLGVTVGLETLDFGRGGLGPSDSCVLEISGPKLHYTVLHAGGSISASAQPMDAGDPPDRLLKIADTADGWRTVYGLIRALERAGIKSLERPIEAGSGPDGWVIA